MAITYEGTIQDLALGRTAAERRALRLIVSYRIFDSAAPTVTLHVARIELLYPTAPFAGLTLAQARTLILDTGVAGIPGLRAIGQRLVADYNAAAILRSVPLPFNFTATTP
jgi:hypothetical protein